MFPVILQILRDLRTEGNDSLPHHHSVFGPPKTQDIHTGIYRYLFHRTIQICTGICQTSTVHVQIHIVSMQQIGNGFHFFYRIDRSQFRNLGDINSFRLGMMANAEVMQTRFYQFGSKFAVGCRNSNNRTAGHPGRSSAFIYINMCRLSTQNTVERTRHSL